MDAWMDHSHYVFDVIVFSVFMANEWMNDGDGDDHVVPDAGRSVSRTARAGQRMETLQRTSRSYSRTVEQRSATEFPFVRTTANVSSNRNQEYRITSIRLTGRTSRVTSVEWSAYSSEFVWPRASHASTVQAREDGDAVDNRWPVSENRCALAQLWASCTKYPVKLSNKTITRLPTV